MISDETVAQYQREGYTMFQQMMGAIKEETIGFMFNVEVQVTEVTEPEDAELTYSAPSETGDVEVQNQTPQHNPGAQAERTKPPAQTQQGQTANGQGSSFFKRPNQ